jgi:hypothetical protein
MRRMIDGVKQAARASKGFLVNRKVLMTSVPVDPERNGRLFGLGRHGVPVEAQLRVHGD